MVYDLRQRLSEFSYGYGVIREVEECLRSVGLRPTPFLPSLLHEAELGFDVGFDRRGIPLLFQFKLGSELVRFVRKDKTQPAPLLRRPFWRFDIDTATSDGQFDLLMKAEQAGCEVYYVAPRFAGWDSYSEAYQNSRILDKSLIITPSEIQHKIYSKGDYDGWHKIAYDNYVSYICSEPAELDEVNSVDLARHIQSQIEQRDVTFGVALKKVYESLSHRRPIRRPEETQAADFEDGDVSTARIFTAAPEPERLIAGRQRRLDEFRLRAVREETALFASLGIEALAAGSQLIAVTEAP